MADGAFDVAPLAFSIDSSSADPAILRMRELSPAVGQAEAAVDRLGQTSKRTATDLAGISSATSASGAAAKRTATDLAGLSNAAGRNSAAFNDMAEAIRATERAEIAAWKASQQLATGTDRAGASAKKAATDFATLYDAANRDFSAQWVAQQTNMQRSARLTTHETLNLTRQIGDVGVSLASGMPVWMVAIQQGDQIRGIFGEAAARGVSFKAALGGIAAQAAPIMALAGAVAAVAGPFLVMVGAMEAGRKESAQVNNALAVTANYANLTSDAFDDMASRVARSTNSGLGAARTTLLDLVSTGQFTGDVIETMGSNIIRLSSLTGKTRDEVASSFKDMGSDVAGFAAEFQAQYHLLTAAQYQHILMLQEQGRTAEAQGALQIAIHQQLGKVAPEQLGYIEQAWRGVGGAIAWAWDMLKGFGRDNGVSAQIERYNAVIANAERNGANPRFIASQVAIRDELQKTLDTQNKLNADAAKNDAGIKAAERMRNEWAGLTDNTIRARQQVEQYRKDVKDMAAAGLGTPSAAQQAATEKAITEKYTPRATAAANRAERAADSAAKAAARHAEQLARQAQAMEAVTTGSLKVADAYDVSGAAALREKAIMEATSKAIKGRADIDAYVARQLNQNAAKAAAAAAEQTYGLEAQVRAQREANDAVAAGTMVASEAEKRMRINLQLLPLIDQMEAASGETKEKLRGQIDRQRTALEALNAEQQRAALLAMKTDNENQLEMIRLEVDLIGASNRVRAVAIAQLQAEQKLRAMGIDPTDPRWKEEIERRKAAANAAEDLADKQQNYNNSLSETLRLLSLIEGQSQDAGRGLAEAFGPVGRALGDLTSMTASFRRAQQELWDRAKLEREKAGTNDTELTRIETEYARQSTVARIGYYGDMASAAKGFFKEGSTAYKAMQAVEMAYRAWQFAASVQAMIQSKVETASTVTDAAISGAADTAAGGAKMFKQLGIFAFPMVAAMVAVLAALGLRSRGGGGAPAIPSAEERQDAQGTGSVLGDAAAKSESLSRSMEIAAANMNKMLEYENAQLASLRNIEAGIDKLAVGLSRELRAGGAFDTSELGLGTKASGNFLWGGSKSTTLNDQGIQLVASTVGEIIANGVVGQTYQEIVTQTKKKILGLTVSNKTKVTTNTAELDAALASEIAGVVGALRGGVIEAAGILGVTGIEALIDGFKVDLGKISFAGLTGAEIEAELEAIFSKLGDDMAITAMPFLAELQKVGEGAFETLTRVAREYTVLNVSLESVGMTFGAVGVSSLAARQRLIDLAGGIEALVEGVDFFAENFLTEAERMAPIQRAVATEMARLGLAGVTTKDQFKNIVLGLDLTTEAGAAMFASLMKVAPAFAKVIEYTDELAAASLDSAAALEKAAAAFHEGLAAFLPPGGPSLAEQIAADRRARLEAERAAAAAAKESRAAAEEEFAALVETVHGARQGLLRLGDVAGAMAAEFSIAQLDASRFTRNDGSINIGALNYAIAEARAVHGRLLSDAASIDALNVQNVGRVLDGLRGQVGDGRYQILGQAAIQNNLAKIAKDVGEGYSNTIRDAVSGFARTLALESVRLGRMTGAGMTGQSRAPGLASVRAAQEDLGFVTFNGLHGIGKDVDAYNEAQSRLLGLYQSGKIVLGDYIRAQEAVDKLMGDAVAYARDEAARLERIAAYEEAYRQSGLKSIQFYFGQIGKEVDALNAAASAAGEPISLVTEALGRLQSVATVFRESIEAATYGGGNMDNASVEIAGVIASAAERAMGFITTQQAKEIADRTGLDKGVTLLLDGLKAFDPTSFEAAFLRMNDALIKGAINQQQYNALFNEAEAIFTDRVAKEAEAAKSLDELRKAAGSLADELLVSNLSPLSADGVYGEAKRQYDAMMGRVFGGDFSAMGDMRSSVWAMIEAADAGATEFEARLARTQAISDLRLVEQMPARETHEQRMEAIAERQVASTDLLREEIKALQAELSTAEGDRRQVLNSLLERLNQMVFDGVPTYEAEA